MKVLNIVLQITDIKLLVAFPQGRLLVPCREFVMLTSYLQSIEWKNSRNPQLLRVHLFHQISLFILFLLNFLMDFAPFISRMHFSCLLFYLSIFWFFFFVLRVLFEGSQLLWQVLYWLWLTDELFRILLDDLWKLDGSSVIFFLFASCLFKWNLSAFYLINLQNGLDFFLWILILFALTLLELGHPLKHIGVYIFMLFML